jgi:hypothetical protein
MMEHGLSTSEEKMTIKKNRQSRFTHSLEGEIETKDKGKTRVISVKGKKTKESLGNRISRFERRMREEMKHAETVN